MASTQLHDGNDDGVIVGSATSHKLAFYNASAISQRAGAAQATSLLASSTDFTATHLAALVEVMDTLRVLGLWKGSA